MRLGFTRLGPGRPGDVEQLGLPGQIQVQCRAGHAVGPGRRIPDGLGPDGADLQGRPPACTGGGPTGNTDSVTFSPAQTRFITATRSAIPRRV